MSATIEPLWKARLGQTVAFSQDSKLLAAGGAHGPVRLLDVETGKLVVLCEGSKNDIYQIAFSKDGRLVAIGELDRRISICDATTGKLVCTLQVDQSEINSLQFNSKTNHLIRAARKSEIEVFETASSKVSTAMTPDPDARTVLASLFSPNGEKLYVSWNNSSAKQQVSVACFSWPDKKRMVSATLDVELVYDAVISSDGRFLALAFSSYSPVQVGVALLDAANCTLIRIVPTQRICSVSFVPSRSLLIASDAENDIECCRLIDSESGDELGRFLVGNRRVFGFDVSADREILGRRDFRRRDGLGLGGFGFNIWPGLKCMNLSETQPSVTLKPWN